MYPDTNALQKFNLYRSSAKQWYPTCQEDCIYRMLEEEKKTPTGRSEALSSLELGKKVCASVTVNDTMGRYVLLCCTPKAGGGHTHEKRPRLTRTCIRQPVSQLSSSARCVLVTLASVLENLNQAPLRTPVPNLLLLLPGGQKFLSAGFIVPRWWAILQCGTPQRWAARAYKRTDLEVCLSVMNKEHSSLLVCLFAIGQHVLSLKLIE